MKIFFIALVINFLLMWFQNAEASLTWIGGDEGYHQFNYQITRNGGAFWYPPYYYSTPSVFDQETNIGGFSGDFNGTASADLIGFAGLPGSIEMTAMAGGRSSAEGITVYGTAAVDQTDLNEDHGINLKQDVMAWISRRFTVDSPGLYALSSDLLGTVNFLTLAGYNYHAYQSVSGTISIEAFEGTGTEVGSITSLGLITDPIFMSELEGHERVELELSPQIEVTDQYNRNYLVEAFYQLRVTLNLQTDIQNMLHFSDIPEDFSDYGDWMIGTDSAPLSLNVTIIPAPLPDTLMLLFSGLLGLQPIIQHRAATRKMRRVLFQ